MMSRSNSSTAVCWSCVCLLSSACILACGHDRIVVVPNDPVDSGNRATGGVGTSDAGTGGAGTSEVGTGGNPTQGQGGSTSACVLDNSSCNGNLDCCSGLCEVHVCQALPTCRGIGQTCSVASDCCSLSCPPVDHKCPAISACAVAGEPCTLNSECCSGACADPGTGSSTCQPLDGCRPVGELCSSTECCSLSCAVDATLGISHCVPRISPCIPVGELCRQGDVCCGDQPGAGAGGAPTQGVCQQTSFGVSRCMGRQPNSQCKPDGPCSIHEDCCSRYCLPTSSGFPAFACSPSCAGVGESCTASRDCCNNASCIYGACRDSGLNCRQIGVGCSIPSECCSGACAIGKLSGTATCVVPASQ